MGTTEETHRRPARRPGLVERRPAAGQDGARRRRGLGDRDERAGPAPAVPGTVVGAAGGARHRLPDLLQGQPSRWPRPSSRCCWPPRSGRRSGSPPWPSRCSWSSRSCWATVPWLGAEATTIATTGLVVLTTGFESDVAAHLAAARHRDRGRRRPAGQRDRVAAAESAYGRRGDGPHRRRASASCWSTSPAAWATAARTRTSRRGSTAPATSTASSTHAWALVRQAQESARMNPRRSAREMRDPQQWHGLLRRMEQASPRPAAWRARSAASGRTGRRGGRRFADPWIAMLGDAGRAAGRARPGGAGGRTPSPRGVHRGAAGHRALAGVADLRSPDHQPAQHHRRHGQGRRGAPDRAATGCRCRSRRSGAARPRDEPDDGSSPRPRAVGGSI